MSTSYPGDYDALTNPTASDPLTSPSHAAQHTNANDAIEAIQQRVGLSGTSFPGSPASGQRFLRTDRNLEYFYDGTRWLTTTLFTAQFTGQGASPITAGGTSGGGFPTWHTTYDLWLDKFYTMMRVLTTNNGSNYWTANLRKITIDTGTVTTIVSPDTSANTVSQWVTAETSIGALMGTSFKVLDINVTATNSPGPLYLYSMLTYRLVG